MGGQEQLVAPKRVALVETWTKTWGPYPGGVILTLTQMIPVEHSAVPNMRTLLFSMAALQPGLWPIAGADV